MKSPHSYQKHRWVRWSARSLAAGSLVLVCLVSIQFFSFVRQIGEPVDVAEIPKADAVVVLTGGAKRIEQGLTLLKSNHARRLLISGVNEHTSRQAIANAVGEENTFNGCCIDLDRLAKDTIGNARHTANWVDLNGFEKLLVVTSNYHMPRSMLLLKRSMPNVELIAVPTEYAGLEEMNSFGRMLSPIIIREFAKYMSARYSLQPSAEFVMSALGNSPKT